MASSNYNYGLRGSSINFPGVYGESNHNSGVVAYGYAPNVAGLFAGSDSSEGIGIKTLVNSSEPTTIMRNNGSGPLLEGYAGDIDDDVPEFIINNNGTVQQELGANGLVKIGALVYCAKADSEIIRHFNNVIGSGPITIDDGDITGSCHIDPGFDPRQSYWVVTNPDPTPHIISCAIDYTNTLLCTRFDTDGNVVDGRIMLLIY
jgi:hypothetical protein